MDFRLPKSVDTRRRGGKRSALHSAGWWLDALAVAFCAMVFPILARALWSPVGLNNLSASSSLTLNLAVGGLLLAGISSDNCPGVRSKVKILKDILAGYAIGCCFLLLLRVPFGRLELATGSAMLLLWFQVSHEWPHRRSKFRIGVAPHDQPKLLPIVPNIEWIALPHPKLLGSSSCKMIITDFGQNTSPVWQMALADAAVDGCVILKSAHLAESLTGRVEVEHLSENSFGSLIPARAYFHVKVVADFVFAVAVIPFALPLIVLIGLAIWAEDSGSVFFRQQRVGYAGDNFQILKFRTMLKLPDRPPQEVLEACEDDRITRTGRFLRRTRLDELPQIFNVLRGEMSWIGPRPEAEALSAIYRKQIPFYRYRHVVKPGISGWAQVNQGHVISVDDVQTKLQYDFYYIKHFSPWLDILILFGTVRTVITGFGLK